MTPTDIIGNALEYEKNPKAWEGPKLPTVSDKKPINRDGCEIRTSIRTIRNDVCGPRNHGNKIIRNENRAWNN